MRHVHPQQLLPAVAGPKILVESKLNGYGSEINESDDGNVISTLQRQALEKDDRGREDSLVRRQTYAFVSLDEESIVWDEHLLSKSIALRRIPRRRQRWGCLGGKHHRAPSIDADRSWLRSGPYLLGCCNSAIAFEGKSRHEKKHTCVDDIGFVVHAGCVQVLFGSSVAHDFGHRVLKKVQEASHIQSPPEKSFVPTGCSSRLSNLVGGMRHNVPRRQAVRYGLEEEIT